MLVVILQRLSVVLRQLLSICLISDVLIMIFLINICLHLLFVLMVVIVSVKIIVLVSSHPELLLGVLSRKNL